MNTSPKRALVTGGSGGIGTAICLRLARDGYHVFVQANRNVSVADTVVQEIIAAGGSAQTISFDITDSAATTAALETDAQRRANPGTRQQRRHP